MKVRCVGLQRVDYTSRKTGNPVLGWSLHCTYPADHVKGLKTESFFISDSSGLSIPASVPCVLDLRFGRYDRIEDISKLPEE